MQYLVVTARQCKICSSVYSFAVLVLPRWLEESLLEEKYSKQLSLGPSPPVKAEMSTPMSSCWGLKMLKRQLCFPKSYCTSDHFEESRRVRDFRTRFIWPVIHYEKKNMVGGFKHFLFSILYAIILPIDFHMFQDA